ncbi:MAG: LysM peptidoglycan-binding domain-containing protein, partial [Bacteroidota bacterium]
SYSLYHPSNLKIFNSEEVKQEEPIFTASVDSTKLYVPTKKVKTQNKQILSDQFEIKNHTVVSGDNLSNIAARYEMKLADLLRLNEMNLSSMITIGQKIKVNRRIPMLEIIAQKLEEKSAKEEPAKKVQTAPAQDFKVEVEEVRKISSNDSEKSFYIAPAESREIVIKSDTKEESKIMEQTQVNLPKETPIIAPEIAKKPAGTVYYIHEVEAGETLFKIAKVYQVSIDDLIKWNNLGKIPTIRVGQKLKLKP